MNKANSCKHPNAKSKLCILKRTIPKGVQYYNRGRKCSTIPIA